MKIRGLIVILALGLTGCATFNASDCARFDQMRRATQYDTVYKLSDEDTRTAVRSFKPLAKGENITAQWYSLRTHAGDVRPCEHLFLFKELYLHRADGAGVVQETREFYTADGRLIATKKEELNRQLRTSGYYVASVPLPIPEVAPEGSYRIVSKLWLKGKDGKRDTMLAEAVARFRVVR